MKKTILSDKIKQYVDKVKQNNKNVKSDQAAIEELIEIMGEYIEEYKELNPRTVRKWMDGDAYPDVEKLIVLSKIFGCTVDELLKDKEKEIRLNNFLPEWYEKLTDKPKKFVFDLLECYRTGELSKRFSPFLLQTLWEEGSDELVEYFKYASRGNLVSVFFEIVEVENNFVILDKYYLRNEMIKKEIENDKLVRQKDLLTEFFDDTNRFKNIVPEEIFKVIDIGYDEGGGYAYYYGELIEDEDGEPKRRTVKNERTGAWNEVGYEVIDDEEFTFLNHYKTKLSNEEFSNLKKSFARQKKKLLKYFLGDFLGEFVKPMREYFSYVGFGGYNEYNDKDTREIGKYYYTVDFLLLIDEKDIEKILMADYQGKLQDNIARMNQSLGETIDRASKMVDLWKEIEEYDGEDNE